MKILAFDTSTPTCSVALSIDGSTIVRQEQAVRQHTEVILPMISGLLAEGQMTLSALDCVAFGRGPGSFMGVRTAASVAQGIAFAHQLPVVGLSTLNTLANTQKRAEGTDQVLVAWDARMNQVYWGQYVYDPNAKIMVAVCKDALVNPEQVSTVFVGNCHAVGNAWGIHQSVLLAACQPGIHWVGMDHDCGLNAGDMIALAEHSMHQGQCIAAMDVQPVYLRNPK